MTHSGLYTLQFTKLHGLLHSMNVFTLVLHCKRKHSKIPEECRRINHLKEQHGTPRILNGNLKQEFIKEYLSQWCCWRFRSVSVWLLEELLVNRRPVAFLGSGLSH